jgi:hypothetical protein
MLAICLAASAQAPALAQESNPQLAPQSEAAAGAAAPRAAESPPPAIPEGSYIAIRLLAPVSSRDAVQGQFFPIALAEPIMFEGREIVPTGSLAKGRWFMCSGAASVAAPVS